MKDQVAGWGRRLRSGLWSWSRVATLLVGIAVLTAPLARGQTQGQTGRAKSASTQTPQSQNAGAQSQETVQPSRRSSILVPPPATMPVFPKAVPVRIDQKDAVWGSSSEPKVVNLRQLSRPPRPYPGPKIAIEHIIEGEDEKISDLEERRGRQGLFKPSAERHPPIGPRGNPQAMFPGSDSASSPFIPPDCTVAAGPEHIIMTVNSLLSVWGRDGTLVQEVSLLGSGGLFGPQGAGGFVFDPKCLYDSYENRYVVVALEYYESPPLSSVLIAVSQPGDAQTWTTFRTDAKTEIPGVGSHWLDYPGLGYDQNAYYVSGNLFAFGDFPSFRGVKFRCFNKQKLIQGVATNNFADVNDFSRSFSSVQAAQHMGPTPTSYFVSVSGTSTRTNLQIHAIKDPLTGPTRSMKVVQISQSYDNPEFIGACCEDALDPNCGAGFINTVDDRVFNATWFAGNLYTAHHFTLDLPDIGSTAVTARWYQVATNGWPTDSAAAPSFVQGGDIPGGVTDDGRPIHTFFPAIHVNSLGDVGVVLGMAVENECAQVAVTGRLATDPPGAMAAPISVKSSTGIDQDDTRWGDYYGISLDPVDGKTFWGIGQWNKQFAALPGQNDSWATWIMSFDVRNLPSLHAVDDGSEAPINVFSQVPKNIDVMANDYDSNNNPFTIDSFDSTTPHNATVTRSTGTGPGGRDELTYLSSDGYTGDDSFTYTIRNALGQTSSATVHVHVELGAFMDVDDPGLTEPGIDVTYYEGDPFATGFPAVLPAPYLKTFVFNLNFPAATGVPFANSGRSQATYAVFSGWIDVPAQDVYQFCIRRGSGASLYLGEDAIPVVEDDGVHVPADDPICAQVGLKKGPHKFRVDFYHATGTHGLILYATGGPLHNQVVPNQWFLRVADCTADFDNSGFVDTDDFTAFVSAFELGGDDADVDGSGFVDTDDFDYFVCAFENGCDCPG